VSSALIRPPSNEKRRASICTPFLSANACIIFFIAVPFFTLKNISSPVWSRTRRVIGASAGAASLSPPPNCIIVTSIWSPSTISNIFGVSSSLTRSPSKLNRNVSFCTPLRSANACIILRMAVLFFTLKATSSPVWSTTLIVIGASAAAAAAGSPSLSPPPNWVIVTSIWSLSSSSSILGVSSALIRPPSNEKRRASICTPFLSANACIIFFIAVPFFTLKNISSPVWSRTRRVIGASAGAASLSPPPSCSNSTSIWSPSSSSSIFGVSSGLIRDPSKVNRSISTWTPFRSANADIILRIAVLFLTLKNISSPDWSRTLRVIGSSPAPPSSGRPPPIIPSIVSIWSLSPMSSIFGESSGLIRSPSNINRSEFSATPRRVA